MLIDESKWRDKAVLGIKLFTNIFWLTWLYDTICVVPSTDWFIIVKLDKIVDMDKDDTNLFGGQEGFKKRSPKSQSKSTTPNKKDIKK